ncbi:HAD family hydrolase, partial [Dubosiella newyorkensis]
FIGEITMKEYTKGTAIDFLKSHYKDYETMAFGDSENDVSMLLEADISVAMGNGNETVKKIADHITDDINKDGLYKAFEYYGLLTR